MVAVRCRMGAPGTSACVSPWLRRVYAPCTQNMQCCTFPLRGKKTPYHGKELWPPSRSIAHGRPTADRRSGLLHRMADLVITRSLVALPKGASVARYLSAFGANDGHLHKAATYAAQWKDTPQVANAFEYLMKAAIAPGTSTDGMWAAPLAQTSVGQEALGLLRGRSLVALLEPRLRHVDFNQQVPRDVTTGLLAAWVAEGAPSPAAALSFSTVRPVPMTKAAVLLAVTRELLRAGTPGALQAINEAVIGGVAHFIDVSFLDPARAAAPGRPASVTNGATAITSTGATAAAILTDLTAML